MATSKMFHRADIGPDNVQFSKFKVLIETAFYGNNVHRVASLQDAYVLAQAVPGTITTDLPVAHTKELGLPADAKVLVFNDGRVVGRTAAARRIIGQPGIDAEYYAGILREALFGAASKSYLSGEVVVGLDKDFMVQSHVAVPSAYANNLYSYMLNFQTENSDARNLYAKSTVLPENDIYIIADPEWRHPDFPNGLALFDPEHNVAAVLGLRYFGELKKGTLTLAWATAHRHGFVACHGGMKRYDRGTNQFTMAAYGLSGSGKSTITLAKHSGPYTVDILHDDAFVINRATGTTTALEPSYFDKTADYAPADPALKYFVTCQNVGVTLDDQGHKVLVTQELRNNNGRAIKSHFMTANRVNHLDNPIDAIFWIMKDDTLPPVLRISDPDLATVFGLTLATKRSTAENLVGKVDLRQLVIEPFANPFRCYPLGEDYADFQQLFAGRRVDCYVLNTGYFGTKKVTPADTLGSINAIVEQRAEFVPFGNLAGIEMLNVPGFAVDWQNPEYKAKFRARMVDRLDYINLVATKDDGYNAVPEEARTIIMKLINQLDR